MVPNEYQKHFRTEPAAKYCGLAKSTFEKLRVYGGGPAYSKLGKICVYALSDLNEWLIANRRHSTSDRGVSQ